MKLFLSVVFLTAFSFTALADTVTGDWVKGRNKDFRYITDYEVKTTQRPYKGVPWIQQDCHDDGQRFANWSRIISYSITYSGGLSFELLGIDLELGGERGQTIEVGFERWIHARAGIKAKHILYEEFENWEGTTRVEFRDNAGVVSLGTKTYPFKLDHMNYGLFVKREILEVCGP
jgi:hypothetical protein